MSVPRRRAALIALAAVGALLLFGCTSDDADTASSDTESAESPSAESPTESTVPAPEATTVAEVLALGRPVVLAHAGGENAHPHSTPYAFAESVRAGVDVLDFDVRLSSDGVLMVQHDDTVDRTTDSTGNVAEMTAEELEALDAAYWFTEQCSACTDQPRDAYVLRGIRTGEVDPPEGYGADDFGIARFEDIVERYPDHVLNVEIKGSYPESVPAAEELARILEEHDKQDAAIVTAFDDELAEAFHELLPEVAITPGLAAMTEYVLQGTVPPAGRTILQIPPSYEGLEVLTPALVERAHAEGLVLWIWPNEREWENADGYTRLLDMGVDGINAADPPVAVQVVRAR